MFSQTLYTAVINFEITVTLLSVVTWLLAGFLSTLLLWEDAGLFHKGKIQSASWPNLTVLTVLCIIFPPLALYMVFADKILQKLWYRLVSYYEKKRGK